VGHIYEVKADYSK